jgi:hypothetical protein
VLWSWTANSHPEDLAAAVRAAGELNGGKATQVAFETVFTSEAHPFDHIKPRAVMSTDRQTADGVEFLRLVDAEGPWVLAAFPTRHAGVWHLVSGLPTTHPRWKKAERWIVRARAVSRCFLNHDDFASIGDRLSEFGDVEVVKVSARVVKDGSSVNRGFPIRVGGGLRPSHLEEIAEVEALGASVRTITLHVEDIMHIHLRRVAGATFYSGDFGLFQAQVLSRLEDATATRMALLTDRQRQTVRQPVRAVTVSLPDPIMKSAGDTADVLSLVRSMTDVSMAVFHRNPYLHFAVTDEFDGSNFDVMITRPDAIDIYPGYRASSTALARITQRIGERFGASSIDDAVALEPVSLDDLTA